MSFFRIGPIISLYTIVILAEIHLKSSFMKTSMKTGFMFCRKNRTEAQIKVNTSYKASVYK